MDKKDQEITIMDIGTNRKINEYISLVAAQNKGLKKVILFGSYGSVRFGKDSDIDIALIMEKLEDEQRFDLQVQLMMLAMDIDLRIEPHPISEKDFSSDSPFAAEIRKTGIEIEPGAPEIWFKKDARQSQ